MDWLNAIQKAGGLIVILMMFLFTGLLSWALWLTPTSLKEQTPKPKPHLRLVKR